MSVEFDRGSPGKFDSRTLNRETLDRWTVRTTPFIIWPRHHRPVNASATESDTPPPRERRQADGTQKKSSSLRSEDGRQQETSIV